MNAERTKTTEPAAIPARCLPAAELNRATDVLLEAAVGTRVQAEAAARAAVAEYADWCAVDLVGPEREFERVVAASAHHLDEADLSDAVRRFAEPDPALLGRLELARMPIRVENPVWMPGHRAVAAAVDAGGDVRGAITALIPLDGEDLAGDLWFMGALGRRLAQVLDLSGHPHKLWGTPGAKPIVVNGRSGTTRLRPAI